MFGTEKIIISNEIKTIFDFIPTLSMKPSLIHFICSWFSCILHKSNFSKNTSLAAKGALAHRLQRRTAELYILQMEQVYFPKFFFAHRTIETQKI